MVLRTLVMLFAALLNAVTLFGGQPSPGLRFEIALGSSMSAQPAGRLLVVIAPGVRFEPKRSLGRTGRGAVPTIGVDVPALAPGDVVTVTALRARNSPYVANTGTVTLGDGQRVFSTLTSPRE